MMLDRELAIAITGIDSADIPGPGTGVARSLREAEQLSCRIAALAYDALEPSIYRDRLFDQSFLLSAPSAGDTLFLERLFYIREAFGLDMVIPMLESELPLYIKYRETLAMAGISLCLPRRQHLRLCQRSGLAEIAMRTGIPVPASRKVSTLDGLETVVSELGLPVMIKGEFTRSYRADSLLEARAYFCQLIEEWGAPVWIQQRVDGESLHVTGVGDGKGNCPGLVAVRPVGALSSEKRWSGISINNPQLEKAARTLVARLKWRGPFELQFIANGQRIWLVGLKPVLAPWVYLSTSVGINLPEMLVRLALKQPTDETQGYPSGRLYVRHRREAIYDVGLRSECRAMSV